MNKYIIMGKNSQETAASMLNKPQNRRDVNQPLMKAFNAEFAEFLYLNHPDFDFMAVVKAENDEGMAAATNLIYAEAKPQLLDYLPIKMVEMIEQFPHTFELSMACFDYPKINIQACEKLAEVDHPGSAYAKHNLGISYAEGEEGLKQSHSEAFYWYLRAYN